MAVTVQQVNATRAMVAGYGWLYGDDGTGAPVMDSGTEFLDLWKTAPILLEHAEDGTDYPIGEAFTVKPLKDGLFVVGFLNLKTEGGKQAYRQAAAGLLGFSAGPYEPLCKVTAGHIDRLAVVEWTLTRTPRDSRQLPGRPKAAIRRQYNGETANYNYRNGLLTHDSGRLASVAEVVRLAGRQRVMVWCTGEGEPGKLPGFQKVLISRT